MSKADTILHLRHEINSLQGFKPIVATASTDLGLGQMVDSFHNASFPISALHEFLCTNREETSSSGAFVAGLLSPLLSRGAVALWVSTEPMVFPPALKIFGINPDQIFFVVVKSEKEALEVIEEGLKCNTLTTVIGEVGELQFNESRRLQLAIEESGVGCYLLRQKIRNLTTAATCRWQLKPLPSLAEDGLPGIGYPRWQVDLLKVRGGKPGRWIIEWADGSFRYPSKLALISRILQKKTG